MSNYIDIRELMSNYERRECWNCGDGRWERLDAPQTIMCRECFMGQRGGDDRDTSKDHITPEGYVDYRQLWYGDVSLAEAKRKYEHSTKDSRERMQRMDARERSVFIYD